MNNATELQTLKLGQKYEVMMASLIGETVKAPEINGEEISTNICTACHQFDQRVVGPPYMSVLAKYENDKDALVQFIMNPSKIDTDYPPMPNQNLRKPEASAVADYLLQEYVNRK